MLFDQRFLPFHLPLSPPNQLSLPLDQLRAPFVGRVAFFFLDAAVEAVVGYFGILAVAPCGGPTL